MKAPFSLLLCAVIVGSFGCNQKEGGAKGEKRYTIAVIPKGTTHEFWNAINAGVFKARDELVGKGVKVDVIWKGPLREDDRDQQIQVVENFTSKCVSGIVLVPLDS